MKEHLLLTYIILTLCGYSAADWHFSGPNIALNKPTTQEPGTYNHLPASLAVDGNNDSDLNHGSCSHTNGLRSDATDRGVAQWTVNLERTYNVTGIIIFNRKDFEFRLDGFEVFGLTGSREDCDTCWFKIYDDKSHKKYSDKVIEIKVDRIRPFSRIAINIPKPKSSDYYNPVFLTLCEVEIYAASLDICEVINVPFAQISPNKDFFKVNTNVTLHCKYGYEANDETISCMNSSNGVGWNPYPKCIEIKCIVPDKPENGFYRIDTEINDPESLTVGSIITGQCNEGYDIINGASRKCQNNTKWTGYPPSCNKKQCPYPEPVAYGKYNLTKNIVSSAGPFFYNSVIILTCNIGFTLEGEERRVCNDQKKWTGNPKCKINNCKIPTIPKNALYLEKESNGLFSQYTGNKFVYLNKVRVFCRDGYFNNASSPVIQCLETKSWSGEIGHCNLVTCDGLGELKDGSYNYSKDALSNGYPYNTIATVICEDHFEVQNPYKNSRKCKLNGEWDNESIRCLPSAKADFQGTNAPIIGLVSAVVVLVLCVIVVVLFFLYRRKRSNGKTGKPKSYANLWKRENNDRNISNSHDDVYSEIQDTCVDTITESTSSSNLRSREKLYINLMEKKKEIKMLEDSKQSSDRIKSDDYYSFTNVDSAPKTAILVQDLSDLILTGLDAKRKFEKEFKELPQGMVQPHKEAVKKKNIVKNRYRNLYAYDDTRVVLKADETSQSDYINACYVHGFKTFKQYIASQGPTKEILLDFWRMIWQEDSSKIVMLTNLLEDGKEKCEQYWPEEGTSHVFGGIIVRTEKIDSFSQFVKRTFQVKKEGSNHKPRTITQYHFTAWPDKGVPKYASSLVQFTHKVKNDSVAQNGPIIVHCSAGVGRTGTFIALDFLTEQGKAMGYVDVFGTIKAFRSQRVCLVQTLDQYIFVHHALVESLMLPTSALPAYKFPDAYQELQQIDTKKRKTKLNLEFETLTKVSPVADESDYVSSKLVRNRRKNRYSNVLPVEEFMPSLMSNYAHNDNRYINAVFLPSYKERQAFIITQTPLENTREDFWDLIWEHDVQTIVMMNNLKETVESEKYWPENDESITFGSIEVTAEGVEKKNKHHLVYLSARKHKVTRKIKQIRCGGWSYKHSLPDSPEVMLTLLEIVKVWQRQSGHHTIVVHCMNGVDKSGLYCVISAVIERLQIEQDVAISQVIEEMRNAREQIIPSVEQYKFCHDTILAFIHQFDTYSNFAE